MIKNMFIFNTLCHKYEIGINDNWKQSLFAYQWYDFSNICSEITQLNVNSLRQSDAYMCHFTKPSLVQIMACHLLGAIIWTNAGLLSIRTLGTNF